MPHFVIDTSIYSRPQFREFLTASPENVGVIPDWTAIEALVSDRHQAVFDSAEIMAGFPRQVVVLHGSFEIAKMRLRAASARKQLVDREKTAKVGQYCANAKAAKEGDLSILLELVKQRFSAEKDIANLKGDNWREAVIEFAHEFNAADLRSIRQGAANRAAVTRIADQLTAVALRVMETHPLGFEVPPPEHFFQSFVFRLNAYMVIFAVNRIETGGEANTPRRDMPNAMRDGAIATCATYFDGLLTGDALQRRTYEQVNELLRGLDRR